MRILITGSEGLVGAALARELTELGCQVVPFDRRRSLSEEVCDFRALSEAAREVEGIVHLAAVSRVVWGERDPQRCKAVNEGSVRNVLRLCTRERAAPWLIFASSREVYGQQNALPVPEEAELLPMNVYARTKVSGETAVAEAAAAGAVANVVRLSNVFGHTSDHHDRVVPAFARCAAEGGQIRVDGGGNVFDFTHISDVVRGLARLIDLTAEGRRLAPIHLVTGRGTSLAELADLGRQHARAPVTVTEAPSRSFDVARFYGSTRRAAEVLGWKAEVPLEEGFADLVDRFAQQERRAVPSA